MKQLEIKDISFSYNGVDSVLNNISFTIDKGTYNTIIGHNGSGKSTIAKLIIGLLQSNSGQILLNNKALSEDTIMEFRKSIGIVFQNPDNQFIGTTVADDIAFGLENHNVDPNKMHSIINEYANQVDMIDFLNAEPTKLSGGQKQRVAIAGILAMKPDIIILDEATSMLDPQGKKEINECIKKINKEDKITIISITHDMEEVVFSDKVIVLNQGDKYMEGTPKEVLTNQEELVKLGLDVPFAWKLSTELRKQGVLIDNNMELKKVVENICQLNAKI